MEQEAESNLQKLAQFYGLNVSALKTEYSLFKEFRRDYLQMCKSVLSVLQTLHQTGLHRVYGELYQLYRLSHFQSVQHPVRGGLANSPLSKANFDPQQLKRD